MSGEQTTIRELLQAIRDETETLAMDRPIHAKAVAALALMDEADVMPEKFMAYSGRFRLILDPGAGSSLPGAPTSEETL